MEIGVLIVILLLVATGLGAALFVISQRLRDLKQTGGVEMLKADVTELNRTIATLQTSLGDQDGTKLGEHANINAKATDGKYEASGGCVTAPYQAR